MNKKIVKDGFLLMLAKLFAIGSGAIVAIFVARFFGVNTYGEYTTAIAFATFILTFTDLGMDTFLLKEVSRDRSLLDKYFSNIILVKILVLTISVIIIIVSSKLLGYSFDVIKIIIITLPNLVIGYIVSTFFVIMQIENKLGVNAKIQIAQSILIILVAIFSVTFKFDIYGYSALQSLISIVILIIYLFVVSISFKPSIMYTKTIVSGSIIFGVSSLLFIIYYKLDTVMLSLIKGTYEVGIYESAYKVVGILIGVVAILDNLVMPRFFQLYKTNVKKMIGIYEYIAKRGLIFGVSFSVVLMYMSKYIINILYGSEYSDSILILEILMWTVVIRLMAAICGFVITASDNMKVKVKFQFIFAILNIIMNVILIPKFGVIGAAISSVITEVLVFITYYIFVQRNFDGKISLKVIIKCIFMNLTLIIILSFFVNLNFILMGIICIAAYCIVELIFFKVEFLQGINMIFKRN